MEGTFIRIECPVINTQFQTVLDEGVGYLDLFDTHAEIHLNALVEILKDSDDQILARWVKHREYFTAFFIKKKLSAVAVAYMDDDKANTYFRLSIEIEGCNEIYLRFYKKTKAEEALRNIKRWSLIDADLL